MPIRFHCEFCDAKIKVPGGSHGRRVKCPRCGQTNTVPGEDPQTAASRQMSQSDATSGESHTDFLLPEKSDEALETDDALAALAGGKKQDRRGKVAGTLDALASGSLTDDLDESPQSDAIVNTTTKPASNVQNAADLNEQAVASSASPVGPPANENPSVKRRAVDKPQPIALSNDDGVAERQQRRERIHAATGKEQGPATNAPNRVPPKATSGPPSPIMARSIKDIPPAKRPLPPSANLSAQPADWQRTNTESDVQKYDGRSPLLADLRNEGTPSQEVVDEKQLPPYTGLLVAVWLLRICGVLILAPIYFRHFSGEGQVISTTAVLLATIEAVVALTVFYALSEVVDAVRDTARNSYMN